MLHVLESGERAPDPLAIPPEPQQPEGRLRPVLWRGPFFDRSGYADETRNFVLALLEQRSSVRIAPLGWGDDGDLSAEVARQLRDRMVPESAPALVAVSQGMPTLFRPAPTAVFNVLRTMFETNSLPRGFAEALNAWDMLLVPSAFNQPSTAVAVSGSR